MSRPLRIEYPGAWYHVMNRGAARQKIYRAQRHRPLFLELMGETTGTFNIQCHAYCLMDNHYHLLIHTPQGNLGRAMRHIDGLYTQRFNRLQKRDGPLFRGRYQAILIDADHYLLAVSRYIHLNPVQAHIVQTPQAYRWSSYGAYINAPQGPGWLHTGQILSMIAPRSAPRRYRAYVEQGLDEELAQFYNPRHQVPVLGSDRFREKVQRYLKSDDHYRQIPERKRLLKRPAIASIMGHCAHHFGLRLKDLCQDGRTWSSDARTLAMALCHRSGGHRLSEIAKVFNISEAGVSSAIARAKRRREADKDFGRTYQQLARSIGL